MGLRIRLYLIHNIKNLFSNLFLYVLLITVVTSTIYTITTLNNITQQDKSIYVNTVENYNLDGEENTEVSSEIYQTENLYDFANQYSSLVKYRSETNMQVQIPKDLTKDFGFDNQSNAVTQPFFDDRLLDFVDEEVILSDGIDLSKQGIIVSNSFLATHHLSVGDTFNFYVENPDAVVTTEEDQAIITTYNDINNLYLPIPAVIIGSYSPDFSDELANFYNSSMFYGFDPSNLIYTSRDITSQLNYYQLIQMKKYLPDNANPNFDSLRFLAVFSNESDAKDYQSQLSADTRIISEDSVSKFNRLYEPLSKIKVNTILIAIFLSIVVLVTIALNNYLQDYKRRKELKSLRGLGLSEFKIFMQNILENLMVLFVAVIPSIFVVNKLSTFIVMLMQRVYFVSYQVEITNSADPSILDIFSEFLPFTNLSAENVIVFKEPNYYLVFGISIAISIILLIIALMATRFKELFNIKHRLGGSHD